LSPALHRVLIVDDEKGVREALKQVLEYEQLSVQVCVSGQEALRAYPQFKPHLVFLDVKMEGMDGLETLKRLRELDADAQVVMISGHGTIQTAVEATQLGAYDFLEKPLDTDRILLTLRNALQHIVLMHENVRLKQEVRAQYEIVGSSKAIRHVITLLQRVAPTPARVLITGENGTGKELVARAIHALSQRAAGPFVEVNCAAIPTELIESELFGHVKGSFTGAFADRAGKFELADGGTLFLDEVGDMSLSAQAKVLRALQEGVIARVGSGRAQTVDVRVIAATNKNLDRQIELGRFREDLLYRLNVVPIHVPSLRERRSDIPQLISHFGAVLTKSGLSNKEFEIAAVERLTAHDWPGNIRELRNAIERLLILATGPAVTAQDVERLVGKREGTGGGGARRGGGGARPQRPLPDEDATWLRAETFEEFKLSAERAFLFRKLEENGWNVSETARTLRMPRSNLYKKLERFGLGRADEGAGSGDEEEGAGQGGSA
jgi:two-component system, NtrC family, nitrogen regulation response regulator NtrX